MILAPLGGLGAGLNGFFPVIRVNAVDPEILVVPVLDRIAEHLLRLRSDIGEGHGRRIETPRNDIQCFNQVLEALLAEPERLLGFLALSDVVDCEEQEHFAADLDVAAINEDIEKCAVFFPLDGLKIAH